MNSESPWLALLLNPGTGVLIALLLAAAWIDWRTMRIPNWLTVAGMCWGLLWNAVSAPTVMEGVLTAVGGLALGLGLFLPLWLLRVMGAGDVKLMAMVGAFLGALATFKAIVFVGLAGGIVVLAYAVANGSAGRLARNVRDLVYSAALPGVPAWRPSEATPSLGRLPYGVSIAAGTIAYLLLRQLG
ncbi:A24 family peptidase [Ramlibacter rhizophilus]|uniref:Prepilin peptidase n=1 Tax=Ramlibacter rhizophilus TaxID=1781167 RepID=A0A4Z0BEJ7_9BURK|nr:A24 family peptidase [Ramlibacter rhizophilus]TFY96893.1 prepilin peptidase [Ramlibacter rhizophilus]